MRFVCVCGFTNDNLVGKGDNTTQYIALFRHVGPFVGYMHKTEELKSIGSIQNNWKEEEDTS